MGRIKTFFNKLFKRNEILLGVTKPSTEDNIQIKIDPYTGEVNIKGNSNFVYSKEYWFPEDNVKNNIMKTTFYLNGQVLMVADHIDFDKLSDIPFEKNQDLTIDGKQFKVNSVNYDLFNQHLEVVVTNKIRFTYDIFVKDFNEYLIDGLEFIGYTKSDVSGTGKNLITNASQGKYYFTDCDYSDGCMGYVCNYNTHALAIAAINNNHDKFQWFQLPFNDYEFCEVENAIEEYGKFEGTEYPKKLTPDEIIKYIEGVNF